MPGTEHPNAEAWKNLRSFNPRVCMDPHVHYTTQSGRYDTIYTSGIKRPKQPKERESTAASRKKQRILVDLASLIG